MGGYDFILVTVFCFSKLHLRCKKSKPRKAHTREKKGWKGKKEKWHLCTQFKLLSLSIKGDSFKSSHLGGHIKHVVSTCSNYKSKGEICGKDIRLFDWSKKLPKFKSLPVRIASMMEEDCLRSNSGSFSEEVTWVDVALLDRVLEPLRLLRMIGLWWHKPSSECCESQQDRQ